MVSKAKSDSVDVHAKTVHYDVIGNEVHTSTSGFQIVEANDAVPEAKGNQSHHVAVEFDSSVPQAVAIDALRAIQKTIETHGLPEAVVKTPRRAAASLLKAQRVLVEAWYLLEKVPPELRAPFERMLGLQPTKADGLKPRISVSDAAYEIKQRER